MELSGLFFQLALLLHSNGTCFFCVKLLSLTLSVAESTGLFVSFLFWYRFNHSENKGRSFFLCPSDLLSSWCFSSLLLVPSCICYNIDYFIHPLMLFFTSQFFFHCTCQHLSYLLEIESQHCASVSPDLLWVIMLTPVLRASASLLNIPTLLTVGPCLFDSSFKITFV